MSSTAVSFLAVALREVEVTKARFLDDWVFFDWLRFVETLSPEDAFAPRFNDGAFACGLAGGLARCLPRLGKGVHAGRTVGGGLPAWVLNSGVIGVLGSSVVVLDSAAVVVLGSAVVLVGEANNFSCELPYPGTVK